MAFQRFNIPVGLLLLGLLLSTILSVSGTPGPVVADKTTLAPTSAKAVSALDLTGTTPARQSLAGFAPATTAGLPAASSTPNAVPTTAVPATTLPPQPLPDSPMTLIRLKAANASVKLVDELAGLAPVKAARLIPVDYLPVAEGQPEQLLALVPAGDAGQYAKLSRLEYAALDQEADTARYFWLKLPTDPASEGETWLDSEWKVLDQVGPRVFFKAELPLYIGFGFRSKLYVHKAPPRQYVPGLTPACPCPALAAVTFAGMALEAPPANPALTEAALKAKLGLITEDRMRQVVDQITKNEVRGKGALNTRYTGTEGSVYAAERLFTYFFALGLNVQFDSFLEGGLGTVASNVVADMPGADPEGKPVLLVGHYDSLGDRNLKGLTPPRIPAYGANDNGIGLAGMMEVARLLSGYRLAKPIRFIAFGAEEQGMLGSRNYTQYSIKPAASTAVINIDSFGYNPPNQEDWIVLGFINYGSALKDAIVAYREKYGIELRLEVKRGVPFFRSDDYYFDQDHHETVIFTDSYNVQSPNNHTANDTVANVNFRTSRKVIQLTLVTVAEQAGFSAA